jgi:hypothetical protein
MPRRAPAFCGAALLAVFVSCTPAETKRLLEPSQALGLVLAEEAVHAAGSGKQIVLILPQWGATATAAESLKAALKQRGIAIAATVSADVGDPMRSGLQGLKSEDFFAALEKAGASGVVISLAGAPMLKPGDQNRLSTPHPSVIIVGTASLGNVMGVPSNPEQLAILLDAGAVQIAIADGADSTTQTSGKADSIHQTFAQNYRILRKRE